MAKKSTKKVAAAKAVKPTAVKKAPVKKVAAKKAPAKKAVKKVAAKVAPKPAAAPAKKAPAKKTPVKASKSPAQGKVVKTTIIARVDVGFGNSLYLRGEGSSLSWDKGVQLENVGPYEWTFSTTKAKGDLNFKFLINDEIWAEGENLSVAEGGTSISSPVFSW